MKITDISGKVKLSNQVEMPYFGLGVYKTENGDEVINSIHAALDNDYRLIDTASYYKNETGVGEAIKTANVNRSELFVTTKVWIDDMGFDATLCAFDKSLKNLNLDYIDMYLVHWPVPDLFLETWRAFEYLYQSGVVKAIGLSNCLQHHIEDLEKNFEVKPMLLQNEFHPRLVQQNLLDFCQEKDIVYQAWSPLMRGRLLDNELILNLADQYKKSPAQILLRWDLQKGVATIPKSIKAERIADNALIFDFELSSEDVKKIDSLDREERTGAHPDNFLEHFKNKK